MTILNGLGSVDKVSLLRVTIRFQTVSNSNNVRRGSGQRHVREKEL